MCVSRLSWVFESVKKLRTSISKISYFVPLLKTQRKHLRSSKATAPLQQVNVFRIQGLTKQNRWPTRFGTEPSSFPHVSVRRTPRTEHTGRPRDFKRTSTAGPIQRPRTRECDKKLTIRGVTVAHQPGQPTSPSLLPELFQNIPTNRKRRHKVISSGRRKSWEVNCSCHITNNTDLTVLTCLSPSHQNQSEQDCAPNL